MLEPSAPVGGRIKAPEDLRRKPVANAARDAAAGGMLSAALFTPSSKISTSYQDLQKGKHVGFQPLFSAEFCCFQSDRWLRDESADADVGASSCYRAPYCSAKIYFLRRQKALLLSRSNT